MCERGDDGLWLAASKHSFSGTLHSIIGVLASKCNLPGNSWSDRSGDS